MSLEMAHKVILPPKKNYIPQFLKQRDINSYFCFVVLKLHLNHFSKIKSHKEVTKQQQSRLVFFGYFA
jgi:hypothetical protein